MSDHPDPVAAFRATAERYVAVVEAADEKGRERWLADLAAELSLLYEAALRLPLVPVESDEPPRGMTHEQWQATFERLKNVLGPHDLYRTVLAFGDEQRTELVGSLADDLADIYRDLKDGLDLLAAGGSQNAAAWEWRLLFWSHWGTHAVEALRVIHATLADTGGPPDDDRDVPVPAP